MELINKEYLITDISKLEQYKEDYYIVFYIYYFSSAWWGWPLSVCLAELHSTLNSLGGAFFFTTGFWYQKKGGKMFSLVEIRLWQAMAPRRSRGVATDRGQPMQNPLRRVSTRPRTTPLATHTVSSQRYTPAAGIFRVDPTPPERYRYFGVVGKGHGGSG